MNNKYEFTDDTLVTDDGAILHRLKARVSFEGVREGDLGGWVENEKNLDVHGDAWVCGDARVSGNARVYGNAWVSGNARVYGNAWVSGNAWVYGDAWVYGNARVHGNAWEVSPLQIQPSKYYINMVNATELRIGCQVHTIAWWLENNERHAAETGETPELAAEMRLYIELAARRYTPELLEVVE